jgi:hypothetical protein
LVFSSMDAVHEIAGPVRHLRRVTPVGLRNDLDRTDFERGEGTIGDACAHHHRQRMLAHQLLEKSQPVHPGHFDIKNDHARYALAEHGDGFIGIGGDTDAEPGIGLDDRLQTLADHGAIVDDQNFNLLPTAEWTRVTDDCHRV